MTRLYRLLFAGGFIVICNPCFAETETDPVQSYSPSANTQYPTNVYWGDTHVHTNLSFDSSTTRGNTLGPDAAYRFAKGESVTTDSGHVARLDRPLDFLVIADHATNMGVVKAVFEQSSLIEEGSAIRQWVEAHQLDTNNPHKYWDVVRALLPDGPFENDPIYASVWQSATALADQHTTPGVFTALIGFEWTAQFNLHRVVIFKDNADKASRVLPLPSRPAATRSDPEQLWQYMQDYEERIGGEILAIPHNGNRSVGVMFALQTAKGQPLTEAYATSRSRWEPLYEVTQIKGDSETHPLLSPDDEFADFERLDQPLNQRTIAYYQNTREKGYTDYQNWFEWHIAQSPDNDAWRYPYQFVRSGLKLGLQQQHQLGRNPFKFGLIGSTDSHTSLATADENNFWGKYSRGGPNKDRVMGAWDRAAATSTAAWKQNAAGYAAVWAQENTRESLFAAMKRKEVYASTGPRMTVRFFGGWDYQADDAFSSDLAKVGYEKGVPMGGDLTQAPKHQTPKFLIRAVKEPDGANLDRVQVIKGWHDAKGELHEKIYDVALSDNRKPNWRGKVKPVGSTVDIANASYSNSIGDPELAVVWTDPDFNKDELAFYYLRVLEIPTPRWTAYDAKFFGLKDLPEEIPMVTQERAYTSPIWYTPNEQ